MKVICCVLLTIVSLQTAPAALPVVPVALPLGCLSATNPPTCSTCDVAHKYFLQNGICNQNVDPNCSAIASNGDCTTCVTGFSLSGYKLCLQQVNLAHCDVPAPNGVDACQTCHFGYTLINLKCYINVPNCSTFDPNNAQTCVTCNSGFSLFNNWCFPTVDHCFAYDTVSQNCQKCEYSYGLSTDGLNCLNTIPFCLQYMNGDAQCFQCAPNTVIDSGAVTCTEHIPFCQTYAINALNPTIVICQECLLAYYLANDNTVCVFYDIVYCQTWNPTYTICLICDGNMVWSQAYNSCIHLVENCLTYTASSIITNPTCTQCKDGFYYDVPNNLCFQIPPCNAGFTFCPATYSCVEIPYCCVTYDNCGHCLTFLLGDGWCPQTNKCFTVKYNCPGDYDCVKDECVCPPGESWCGLFNACVPIPFCCATHDGCGSCITQNAGQGWCVPTQQCYQLSTTCPNNYDCITNSCLCNVGLYWDATNLVCKPAPQCCATSDLNGNCLTFLPNSGWCAQTSACYYYPTGCISNDWDCVQDTCNCGAGFTWCPLSQSCNPIPTCCLTNDACGKCLTFVTGKSFCKETNSCYDSAPDCINWDCVNNLCYDLPNPCPQGQTFCYSLNVCLIIPTCCDTHDDCGNCLTTIPGQNYCKLTESCYPEQTSCSAFDCIHQTCLDPQQCSWGQTFCATTNSCVDTPYCCKTYDDCGNCLTFLPFTGWCVKTNQCYFNVGCTHYDCVSDVCLDVVTSCSPGQTFCPTTQLCVDILPCCNAWDQCGNCLTFIPETDLCSATGQCYIKPTGCVGTFDCNTGLCSCTSGSWCASSQTCVSVPSCCATSDGCGNCLTFQANQNWCQPTKQCFTVSNAGCTNWDCITSTCLDGLVTVCASGQTFCELTNDCVAVPACCLTYDSCGNCLTTNPGTGWCISTQQCYNLPTSCTNYDCETNTCLDNALCPSGQVFSLTLNSCIMVPSCCSSIDTNGNCVTFLPFTNWCAQTNSCYFLFSPCYNYDCANTVCLDLVCSPTETFCPNQNACVVIPTCCSEYDNCGLCITPSPGYGFCLSTNQCYKIPTNCLNYDCDTDTCLQYISCPVGQTYCVSQVSCVETPPCCLTADDCGNCLTFIPSSGWCSQLNQCYYQPADCPYYDCVTQQCSNTPICGTDQEYCAAQTQCVNIPSCCDTTDGCGVCVTFKPSTGFCSATSSCFTIPPNCQQYDCVNSVCTSFGCNSGETLCSTSNSCVPILPCCDTFTDCGFCSTFLPDQGYCSATGQCFTKPSNCINYDCLAGQCADAVCASGQTLCPTNNQCVTVPTCCVTNDACGNCLTTTPGTGYCSQTNQCFTLPSNCVQWDCVNSVCLDIINCSQGEVYCPAQNVCYPIPSCCVLAEPCGNGCLTFNSGTAWCSATQQCTTIPSGCPASLWDCVNNLCSVVCTSGQDYCTATGTCANKPTACPNNYNCVTGQCNPPVCTSPATLCVATNQCVTAPSCCLTQDSCGTCLTITAGFSQCLADKQCYQIPTACPNANDGCGNCNCPSGKTLCTQTNQCVTSPSLCVLFDTCGFCYQCITGYTFLNGACSNTGISNCVTVTNNLCTQCGSGYIVFQGACVGLISNCQTQSGSTCNQCESGFTLSNNACFVTVIPNCQVQTGLTCTTCNPNFVISQNACYAIIPQCLTQIQTTCSVCNSGYTLNQNACYVAISNCLTQVQNTCNACNSGFFLSQNLCFAVISNCLTQVQNTCNACNSGFVLANNQCTQSTSIANCQQISNSVCLACITGYYLNNNQCFPAFCSTYNVATSTCTACSLSATLVNGVCVYIEGCTQYNFNTASVTCTQCKSILVLGNQGTSCLGAAHFIIKSGLTIQTNPTTGYFALNSSNQFSLSWGSFQLGTSNTIWYLTKYPTLGVYTLKTAIKINGVLTSFYLAHDSTATPFLTTNFVGDNTTFWVLNVQNVNNVNLWSLKSQFDNKFLGENLSMSTQQVYFNLI